MTIRRLLGTPTVDAGVFWETLPGAGGWKLQFNKTLDRWSPLNPYRLLDPEGYLWASSDSLEELRDGLPGLVDEFAAKSPVVSKEAPVKTLIATIEIAVRLAETAASAAPPTPSDEESNARSGRPTSRTRRG